MIELMLTKEERNKLRKRVAKCCKTAASGKVLFDGKWWVPLDVFITLERNATALWESLDAADARIAELEAENKRLRAALNEILALRDSALDTFDCLNSAWEIAEAAISAREEETQHG